MKSIRAECQVFIDKSLVYRVPAIESGSQVGHVKKAGHRRGRGVGDTTNTTDTAQSLM